MHLGDAVVLSWLGKAHLTTWVAHLSITQQSFAQEGNSRECDGREEMQRVSWMYPGLCKKEDFPDLIGAAPAHARAGFRWRSHP